MLKSYLPKLAEIQGQRQYFIHSYTHRVLQIYTQAMNESIHLFTNG